MERRKRSEGRTNAIVERGRERERAQAPLLCALGKEQHEYFYQRQCKLLREAFQVFQISSKCWQNKFKFETHDTKTT